MTTTELKPTACNLCYVNCGILAHIDKEIGRPLWPSGVNLQPERS